MKVEFSVQIGSLISERMLNGHTFALTVAQAGLFEDDWLLEVDAIAEA